MARDLLLPARFTLLGVTRWRWWRRRHERCHRHPGHQTSAHHAPGRAKHAHQQARPPARPLFHEHGLLLGEGFRLRAGRSRLHRKSAQFIKNNREAPLPSQTRLGAPIQDFRLGAPIQDFRLGVPSRFREEEGLFAGVGAGADAFRAVVADDQVATSRSGCATADGTHQKTATASSARSAWRARRPRKKCKPAQGRHGVRGRKEVFGLSRSA